MGKELWRWSSLRGYSKRSSPQDLPADIATVADNIELIPGSLGKRRPSTLSIEAGGPSGEIHYLSVYRPAGTAFHLWAFSASAPMVAHSFSTASLAWTSRSISDAATSTGTPDAITFNQKFFIAYDSSVNRLHVYDPTLNVIRRVGLSKPSAPTVADTGTPGVAYAATTRYYRIQFLIKDGTTVVAASELSAAVSFTPDGSHTHARITKSTTVDSATHWRIYGLIGPTDTYDLYEQVGSDTVIATTTLDDNTAPASYSGALPQQLGLNIPPPSAKYLLTDDNRLVMAGAHETSGSAGETTPKNGRVWFTRVLGSSDIGDDESIPDTTDQRNWIDVGNDGDSVVGLAGPIGGLIYVFKSRSIWELSPTGIDTIPYRARRVSHSIGASLIDTVPHRSLICTDEEVYFNAEAGPHRISPTRGVEYIGWDLDQLAGHSPVMTGGTFDATRRLIVFLEDPSKNFAAGALHVFNPLMSQQTAQGWRGGWVRWLPTGFDRPCTITSFAYSGVGTDHYITWAGSLSAVARLEYFGSTAATDATSALNPSGIYNPTITSRPLLAESGNRRMTCEAPIVESECSGVVATTPALALIADYGRSTRSVTCPSFAAAGSETRRALAIQELAISDAQAVQIKYTWASNQTQMLDAIALRYKPGEPL